MEKQKYLVNLNHISGDKSLNNFEDIVDGFFVSSCHLKKDKMIKFLKSNHNIKKNVFIDFFHYVSTVEISKNSSLKFKEEIENRLIKDFSINENLIGLYLNDKQDKIKECVEKSVSNWIEFVNKCESNFIYSIPFPMIGSGKIYKYIIQCYFESYKRNLKKISNISKFIHIVLKVGNNLESYILDEINKVIDILKINEIFISIWRTDDALITNKNESSKIIQCVEYFVDKGNKEIYLNYLHNEFLYYANYFKDKINFVFGTYEQTKILSPKIRWMNDEENSQRFYDKIFSKMYGISFNVKSLKGLVDYIVVDNYMNEKTLNLKRNDFFKLNIINMKDLARNTNNEIIMKIYDNVANIFFDNGTYKLFKKITKYGIENYKKLYLKTKGENE